MKKLYWILPIILSIFVFSYFYFYVVEESSTVGPFAPGPNVRISTKPLQTIKKEQLDTHEKQSENDVSIESPTSATTITSSSPEILVVNNTPDTLRFHILDALDEPIQKGVITLEGREHTFYSGLFLTEDVPKNDCDIIVSAEGYSTVKDTYDSSKPRDYFFTLEYTSVHSVTVFTDQSNRKTCSGADVYIWHGRTPSPMPFS